MTETVATSAPMPSDAEFAARRGQIFPKLSDAQLARIAPVARERVLADGERAFTQGEENVPFFVVHRGRLRVASVRRGEPDETSVVHEAGEFTDEANMLSGMRSLVTGFAD